MPIGIANNHNSYCFCFTHCAPPPPIPSQANCHFHIPNLIKAYPGSHLESQPPLPLSLSLTHPPIKYIIRIHLSWARCPWVTPGGRGSWKLRGYRLIGGECVTGAGPEEYGIMAAPNVNKNTVEAHKLHPSDCGAANEREVH